MGPYFLHLLEKCKRLLKTSFASNYYSNVCCFLQVYTRLFHFVEFDICSDLTIQKINPYFLCNLDFWMKPINLCKNLFSFMRFVKVEMCQSIAKYESAITTICKRKTQIFFRICWE